MIDEPDQEDVHSDKVDIVAAEIAWHSKPMVKRERTPKLSGPEPKLTPEQKIAEQKRIESFLKASAEAGVEPEELAERLAKAAEHLKADKD